MIRFLFRLLAYIALAVGVMFAVIDATRSVGLSEFVYTPFGESFAVAAPELLESLRAWLAANAPEFMTEDVLATLLWLPTFAVCAILASLLYVIGKPPRRRGIGFSR